VKLADTQQLFWQLIRAPEGVLPGLRQLDMSERDLAQVVRGDARLSATARLDIYANMYFFRLRDILAGDFPALAACLGEADFHNLVTDYLWARPSQHQSVRNVGARLAEFVAAHEIAEARPWLAELAQLEWARIDVFDGRDAATVDFAELRSLDGAALTALPLALIPCARLLATEFAVDDVWRQVEAGELGDDGPAAPAAEPRTLLVWRQEVEVYHRAVDALERAALSRVQEGTTFGLICELVAAELPEAEAAPRAFSLLANWASDGLLQAR
jgi:hypothetical protein